MVRSGVIDRRSMLLLTAVQIIGALSFSHVTTTTTTSRTIVSSTRLAATPSVEDLSASAGQTAALDGGGVVGDAVDTLLSTLSNAEGVVKGLVDTAHGRADSWIASAATTATTVRGADDPTAAAVDLARRGAAVVLDQLRETVLPVAAATPAPIAVVATAAATYALLSALLTVGTDAPPASPYPMRRYDPVSARAYFDRRPWLLAGRALTVATLSAGFLLRIARDYLTDELSANADRRADQLTELLTTLGPSFIKIGQSLSIRTDLLSPAYIRGLKSLQDQVPAFDTNVARAMIEDELSVSVDEVFENFPDRPVAAASLGQVYKARRRDDGADVAIKVQRPDIMDRIALDMHLIREVAPILMRTFALNTDLVGTTDAWGVGFVDELNYLDEADNAERFTASMETTPLNKVVFSPPVVSEYTTEKVLTTEWVDGERLDRSDSKDVTILCSIAMNTYLTMMLETGLLHCDPHPGNLLRTPDGRLCILDWGMVTRLDSNLQVTLIEHMAHLTSADYAEVPRDLLLLGFIPENKAHLIEDSGVVETLADIYGAWTVGGGAATVNVNKVISQLQDLTATRGNLFQIPAYFAYIAKSFSVLEGIGLCNDANYSIINECLPYVSKRLLTDRSERTGGALGTFVFGPDKNSPDRVVDYDRVEQLVTGFGDYSTSASGALLGNRGSRVRQLEEAADGILDLVLLEEGDGGPTPLQNILLEQLAKIVSSSTRNAWAELREASGTLPSGRSVLGTLVDPLGLWRTSPVVRMNDLDRRTVQTTRDLVRLIQRRQQQQSGDGDGDGGVLDDLSNDEVVELSRVLVRKVWDRRRGVALTGGKLFQMLVTMTADKLERGEREVLVLEDASASKADDGERKSTIQEHSEKVPSTSSRLQGARQILAQLEKE